MGPDEVVLPEHERHMDACAQQVAHDIHQSTSGEDIMEASDKVDVHNIFKPGHGHGGGSDGVGGLGAMAAIAALGNRNDTMRHDGFGGLGGIGGGLIGGLIGGLLFNRRDGIGGAEAVATAGNGNVVAAIATDSILSKLGTIEGAVPIAALQTQAALGSAIGSLALGTQQGFANVKDTVQNTTGLTLAAIAATKDTVQNLGLLQQASFATVGREILTTGCALERAVQNEGDKTRAMLAARFGMEDQTKIQTLANEVIELRNEGRARSNHDELRLQITNTNTAVAAQAQGQAQQQQQQQFQMVQALFPVIQSLVGDLQAVKQGQVIFNSGTMAASGTQAAANTKVA